MDDANLKRLAEQLAAGRIGVDEFLCEVEGVAWLDGAAIDVDRPRRCGLPEAIYGPGKSPELVVKASRALTAAGQNALATRIDETQAEQLAAAFPAGEWNEIARTFLVRTEENPPQGSVAVVTAGSTDLPVAAEAIETLRWLDVGVAKIEDVGVAGPQRLAAREAELSGCDAVIVVAGMEGALPSVVAGRVACPVIAAPTSVGYGANFGGLAALLAMLSSCAAGVSVVNIDAGFKAGCVAGLIAKRAAAGRGS